MTEKTSFIQALPVWQKGMETEMNHSLLFRALIPAQKDVLLRIAGHTAFNIFINGKFLAAGPARAGHDHYRVDEYALDALLTEEVNVLAVLVAGYNVNSFAYLDRPAFLCCEVLAGDEVLAATGRSGFTATHYSQRVKKVQRYSFQRPFAESYRLDGSHTDMLACPAWRGEAVELAPTGDKVFLKRGAPYPEYGFEPAVENLDRGTLTYARDEDVQLNMAKDRAISRINSQLKGFVKEDLEELTVYLAARCQYACSDSKALPGADADLAADSYATFRLAGNRTGFVELTVTAEADTTVMMTFDELYDDGVLNFFRLTTSNVVVWHLKGGATYALRSFEPYTMQYLRVHAIGGGIQLRGLGLRRFDFPSALLTGKVAMPTDRLQAIYDAAIETFRQNTVDVYMDCPSRERAGWLCDSYFTSRVERCLTGASTVETCFLENFLLPEKFEYLPEGMLPMCYPSDHYDETFIPNWAMWFVLELEEYLARTGDRALVDAARDRMYKLLAYFRRFENGDGLLEKLESWVFLEWSRSNQLVQDISYPSNMLYARMKEAMASLYGDAALAEEAAAMKQTIRSQCWLGDFFCDNAVYGEDGVAHLSGEATESCQYYAFFTGTATPETHPELWNTLVNDFGPDRKDTGAYPQVAMANAFIGNYLRLELLYRAGLTDKVVENIDGYFHYMAQRTGTLWEHVNTFASCDHGFASHVIYWLNGIYGNK